MMKKLKIGVLGVGHLGKIHLKCIQQLPETYELIGFYDPNEAQAKAVMAEFQIAAFENVEALIDTVDVIDIVTPTPTHFELAQKVIIAGKHLFIEKPITKTIAEAEMLLDLLRQHPVKAQVGHVERFNPALLALSGRLIQPMFIEGHRLATFNPRGTDVSVVLDLMIHDLDIVLSLVNSPVMNVSASGVAVVSDTPDIANARIEFANGCVANLTASRISIKQMRKLRLFQPNAYVSLDFLEKKAQIVQLSTEKTTEFAIPIPTEQGEKWMTMEEPFIEPINAIKMELQSLAESIQNDQKPTVPMEDGYKALYLAQQILDSIQTRQEKALSFLQI